MNLQTRASSSGNQTPTSSRSTVTRKARTPQQAVPSTVTTSTVVSSVPSPVATATEKPEVKGNKLKMEQLVYQNSACQKNSKSVEYFGILYHNLAHFRILETF